MSVATALRADLANVDALVSHLGLAEGYRPARQSGGLIIRCPWHEERTPSCSVHVGRDGTIAVRCHSCDATGDALSLVAVAHGLNVRHDFREVIRVAAAIAGRPELADGDHDHATRRALAPRRSIPTTLERVYPPANEIGALLAACGPTGSDAEVRAYLANRGLDADLVDVHALGFVIAPDADLPRWASFRGSPWTRTGHRLIVPMHDAAGTVRSVRAWRVTDCDAPKRLPPGGFAASGLVMADEFALGMLKGTYSPRRIIICEGEPDYFVAAVHWAHVLAARIGIVNGSWSEEIAAKIPDGAEVAIWTDDDPKGDRYAAAIVASLVHRCVVRRPSHESEAA